MRFEVADHKAATMIEEDDWRFRVALCLTVIETKGDVTRRAGAGQILYPRQFDGIGLKHCCHHIIHLAGGSRLDFRHQRLIGLLHHRQNHLYIGADVGVSHVSSPASYPAD